jgi:hypothetical protein
VALEHGASVVGAFVVGAVVGADDGRTVGVSVGAVVGTFVGADDGRELGACEGLTVGDWVGAFVVGADDGRELGACEGLTVGDWVGAFVVGADEGTDDGGAMGAFVVGADEGANDGLPDGVSVGAVVLHSISFTTLAACSEATAIVGHGSRLGGCASYLRARTSTTTTADGSAVAYGQGSPNTFARRQGFRSFFSKSAS